MYSYVQVTAWLMVSTGCLAILTSLVGYTAVGMESRCLLATVSEILLLTTVLYDPSVVWLLF
jgi:hypothetical protein